MKARLTKVLLLTGALVVAGASSSLACEPPKPETKTIDVVARGMLCGDPRLGVRVASKGDVAATVRLSFMPGDQSKTQRRYVTKTVAAGSTKIIWPRWVRGWVGLSVFDPSTDSWERLFSFRVGKQLKPSAWGTNGCPSSRFAKPNFRKAHIIGSYENSWEQPFIPRWKR